MQPYSPQRITTTNHPFGLRENEPKTNPKRTQFPLPQTSPLAHSPWDTQSCPERSRRDDIRYTTYDIRDTQYAIRNTRYEIRTQFTPMPNGGHLFLASAATFNIMWELEAWRLIKICMLDSFTRTGPAGAFSWKFGRDVRREGQKKALLFVTVTYREIKKGEQGLWQRKSTTNKTLR